MKLTPYQIILSPVRTEKSLRLMRDENKYTFYVHPKANKTQIKEAVQKLFGVRVLKVNVVKLPPKVRRWGRGRPGRTSWKKKAIVKLPEGETIAIFEGM